MTRVQYNEVVRQIEAHMEGDGYHVNIRTANGGCFSAYAVTPPVEDVVMLSKADRPPVWIAVQAIVAIELCS